MSKQQPIELFMPPNILKAKLGGDSHSIDFAAIKRAEAAIEEIKAEFPDWIAEDIALLTASCGKFLSEGDGNAVGRLFRASHDLKGQAATFEYPLVARIAASLCQLIETTEKPEAINGALALAHVEAIRVIFREKIKSMSDRTALELTEELERKVHAATERNAAAK
jgi:chemotaxis protein histidine kinase CheA